MLKLKIQNIILENKNFFKSIKIFFDQNTETSFLLIV